MHLRHKVPTIFNIYMLDVICCALGCVILLWQVAHQEAETQTASAKTLQDEAKKQGDAAIRSQKQFEQARHELRSASSDVSHLQTELADWRQKQQNTAKMLAAAEKERDAARINAADRQSALDKTRVNLDLSQAQLKKLEGDLEKLLASYKKTDAERTGLIKVRADLLAKIALAGKEIASLKDELSIGTKKAAEQASLAKLSDDNTRKLQKFLDALKDDNKDVQTKLRLTELLLKTREQDLDKSKKDFLAMASAKNKDLAQTATELADAKVLIASLLADRERWKDQAAKDLASAKQEAAKLTRRITDLQAEADQRFAGIPLTGENVVFLIDISASMALKDEETPDPDKWPLLCETVMKLMKSIPTMKRFQVILFSDKTSYLFGQRDAWYKYEGGASAKVTYDALRKVKAEGGTNMHDAFAETFRFRKNKLDTIYLFSDGLPNIGEGVPASVANPTEAQRNQLLSKFVRDKLQTDWNRAIAGQPPVRINAVGFFFESPDVGAFLWALAREHKGSFVGLR